MKATLNRVDFLTKVKEITYQLSRIDLEELSLRFDMVADLTIFVRENSVSEVEKDFRMAVLDKAKDNLYKRQEELLIFEDIFDAHKEITLMWDNLLVMWDNLLELTQNFNEIISRKNLTAYLSRLKKEVDKVEHTNKKESRKAKKEADDMFKDFTKRQKLIEKNIENVAEFAKKLNRGKKDKTDKADKTDKTGK